MTNNEFPNTDVAQVQNRRQTARALGCDARNVDSICYLLFVISYGSSPESVGKPKLGWMQESTGSSSLFAVSIHAGRSKGQLPFANPGDIKVELFTQVNGRGVEVRFCHGCPQIKLITRRATFETLIGISRWICRE